MATPQRALELVGSAYVALQTGKTKAAVKSLSDALAVLGHRQMPARSSTAGNVKSISAALRRAVRGAGVSRYRLAKDIGVSEALLWKLASGRGGVSLEVLDRLTARLGLRLTQG